MDKKRAIHILTKSAKLYKEHLEDQKLLFVYGWPSDIKRQLDMNKTDLEHLDYYETVFHRYNFQHLTGVKTSEKRIASAIQFYEMCLAERLTEDDFTFSKDGSTVQKLAILEHMMLIGKNATMIGNFTDRGPKLYAEKAAGGIQGCVGFVKDRNTGLNVPNTLLNKDIRDVTASPTLKIYAVFSKAYQEERYSVIQKLDKRIDIHTYHLGQKIDNMIDLEKIQRKRK